MTVRGHHHRAWLLATCFEQWQRELSMTGTAREVRVLRTWNADAIPEHVCIQGTAVQDKRENQKKEDRYDGLCTKGLFFSANASIVLNTRSNRKRRQRGRWHASHKRWVVAYRTVLVVAGWLRVQTRGDEGSRLSHFLVFHTRVMRRVDGTCARPSFLHRTTRLQYTMQIHEFPVNHDRRLGTKPIQNGSSEQPSCNIMRREGSRPAGMKKGALQTNIDRKTTNILALPATQPFQPFRASTRAKAGTTATKMPSSQHACTLGMVHGDDGDGSRVLFRSVRLPHLPPVCVCRRSPCADLTRPRDPQVISCVPNYVAAVVEAIPNQLRGAGITLERCCRDQRRHDHSCMFAAQAFMQDSSRIPKRGIDASCMSQYLPLRRRNFVISYVCTYRAEK